MVIDAFLTPVLLEHREVEVAALHLVGARSQAFKVELAAPIAAALIGPGAKRLMELESLTKRRFFLEGKPDTHLDHFVVLAEGKLPDLAPEAPVEEGA